MIVRIIHPVNHHVHFSLLDVRCCSKNEIQQKNRKYLIEYHKLRWIKWYKLNEMEGELAWRWLKTAKQHPRINEHNHNHNHNLTYTCCLWFYSLLPPLSLYIYIHIHLLLLLCFSYSFCEMIFSYILSYIYCKCILGVC